MGPELALAMRRAWGDPAYAGDVGPSFPPQRASPRPQAAIDCLRVVQELTLHSLRCLEEVLGRIIMLLLQDQTRKKEFFPPLTSGVPTHRGSSNGHQIALKCSGRLGKHTQGSCNLVDTHCRPRKTYPSKVHNHAGIIPLFPLPEETSLAITKQTPLLQIRAGDGCLQVPLHSPRGMTAPTTPVHDRSQPPCAYSVCLCVSPFTALSLSYPALLYFKADDSMDFTPALHTLYISLVSETSGFTLAHAS